MVSWEQPNELAERPDVGGRTFVIEPCVRTEIVARAGHPHDDLARIAVRGSPSLKDHGALEAGRGQPLEDGVHSA
jgi:hypothetical protein